MGSRLLTSGLAATVLLAAAPVAQAAEVWAKANADLTAMEADYATCASEAEDVGVEINMGRVTPMRSPLAPVVGMAVGAGFSAVMTPKARLRYVHGCMIGRGYAAITLTAQEDRDLAQQSAPAARHGWLAAFYQRADFVPRLAAATPTPTPGPPPAPRAPGDALAYGAFRFDPATLKAADGVVMAASPVLAGSISFRRAFHVTTAVKAGNISIAGGSIAYARSVDDPRLGPVTYWCGRMRMGLLKIAHDYCAWEDAHRFTVYDYDYPMGLQDRSEFLRNLRGASTTAFALDTGSPAPVGPVDFSIVVKTVSGGGVSLRGVASSGGETWGEWTTDLLFDEQGRVVLPFWTHRLVLTRTGDGVTATFTPDGDGRGWDDAQVGVPAP